MQRREHMIVLLAAAALLQGTPDTLRLQTLELVPGERIAVHEGGEGPPVVIIPGLLGSAFGFRKITSALIDEGHRVLVVDPLGTGSSAAPEHADYSLTAQAARVGAAVRALGIDEAVFVCHSTGASICLRLALREPALVGGIVSINGGPAERMKTPGIGLALKLAPILKLFGGAGMARGKVRDGLQKSSADPSWVTQDVVHGYTAHYRDGVGAVLSTMNRMSKAEEPALLAPELSQIESPVHVLVGADAGIGAIPPAELQAISTIPEVTVDNISDVGQYIHEEQPELVIDAVLDMVRRTSFEPSVSSASRRAPIDSLAASPRPAGGAATTRGSRRPSSSR
jgi:pimeloyl-ACP methyl ester carboxylesterase